ncbi:MAG: cadherin-like beta sandwich domain-containing protein, partial [Treponema sp.]|nr:cadherin-like beta sandwich domain-containing protein [Treponema sp.]
TASLTVTAEAGHDRAVLNPADGTLTKELIPGSPVFFEITVTAEDGTTTRTYRVTVTRATEAEEDSDAALKSLEPSQGTLEPAFDPETGAYTLSVGNEVASLTVSAQARHAGAVLDPASGILSKTLSVGSGNVFTITVTAKDGTATRTYTITATRAATGSESNDAALQSLELSAGTLDPAFDPETTSYAVSVGNGIASLAVTGTKRHSGAALDPADGAAAKALNVGSGNVFAITVTAEDGTTQKTYTVTVTRAATGKESGDASLASLALSAGTLSPAFAPETTSYTVAVGNEVERLTVTGTKNHPGAALDPADGVVAKALTSGSDTVFAIAVTAEDGTPRTYTVAVTRAKSADAALRSLAPSAGTLSPAFAPETTNYAVSVGNEVASLTVAGVKNHAGAVLDPAEGAVTKDLTTGSDTVFAIAVTAEDGSSRTYTVAVTRAKSADAALRSLAPSAGTLEPAFSPETTNYTLSVWNSVASLTLSAAANHAAAVLNPEDGTLTKDLSVGDGNTFAFTVTAENGTTTKTYTVAVTRAADKSADADLASLAISPAGAGTLIPPFTVATTAYALAVENGVANLTVSGVKSHPGAALDPASGSVTKALTVGSGNTFTITVTAENGTQKTYTVTVTRDSLFGENPGEPLAAPALLPYLTQISVSWQAVAGASAYRVYYGPAGQTEALQKAGNDSLGTSRNITGLQAGASYDVYVRALMSDGQHRLSVKATAALAPEAPAGLSAQYTGPGALDLAWTASPGATSYQVYYSPGLNDSSQAIFRDPVYDPVYSFSNLDNGAVYYFWVKAENSGSISAFSAPATITMPVPPPRDITVSSLTEKLRLNWTTIQGADSYEVQHSASASFSGAATTPATGDSLTLTNLQNGAEYSIRIRSVHSGGVSEWSSMVKGTPQPSGDTLAAPVIVRIGRSADHSAPRIVLLWNPVNGAEYYEVSYSAGGDPEGGTKISTITDNACDIDTGLTRGTSYNVWVRAINDVAGSAWSAPVAPQTPGAGFDPRVFGVYFSRYPFGRAYYMDGYQIGSVGGMTSEFPFNKTLYSNTNGIPGCFENEISQKETPSGYEIQDDDQYLFYNDLGRFGWQSIGVIRMIFHYSDADTGILLIENLKGLRLSGNFCVKFTINDTFDNGAIDYFRGANSGSFGGLSLPQLKARVMQDDDAGVAYPGIRLGYYRGSNAWDMDSDFHPNLLPPEPLSRAGLSPSNTDEECWPAVNW